MKKIVGISLASLLIISCGGNNSTNTNATASPKTNGNVANNAVNTNTTSANTTNTNTANANKPVNATATKPAESGPKRIAFGAGKSESTENLTLAAGESKQFVIGAKTAQILMIDAESIDAKISLIKGKVAKEATLEEPGHYDTTLLENGDFVFEVKNTSKSELKTSIKIIISGTHESDR